MNSKKWIALGTTSLALVLGLSGCGQPLDDTPKQVPVAQETPTHVSISAIELSDILSAGEEQRLMRETPVAKKEPEPVTVIVEQPAPVPEVEPTTETVLVAAPEPVAPVAAQTQQPVVSVPVVVTPTPVAAPAPVVPAVQPAPVAVPAPPVQPVTSNIYVGISGGQGEVDSCKGPVRFTPVVESVMVVEHDGCGGWARFGNMKPGSLVSLSGQVGGTYKVGGQIVVNKGSYAKVIADGFGGYPPLLFQTCIPGTNRMVITAAYPA